MKQVKLADVSTEVSVKEGKLFFGNKEVQGCDFIKEDSVAKLYVIRVRDDWKDGSPFWGFVTGLDLVDKGFWLGGVNTPFYRDQQRKSIPPATFQWWSQIEYVLNELCADTIGKEWAVFEEEDFEAQQAEWNEEQEQIDHED